MRDGFLRNLTGHTKKKTSAQASEVLGSQDGRDGEYASEPSEPKLQLLKFDGSEGSLWEKAWEQTKVDPSCTLPVIWHLESLSTSNEVDQVAREAQARAQDTQQNERHAGHSKYTYRHIFDSIVNYANKFKDVGDLVLKADPGYASVPWALVRFCLTLAVSESETYHRMLAGTEFATQLVAQYPVIEKTYARVDSKLATAVRKTIFDLYLSILKFQVFAIQYFDPDAKAHRTERGFNPVSADNIKNQIESIHSMRTQVNEDLILVHSEVTKRGIEDITEKLDSHQQEIMQITKDGILALAQNTGSSFQKQTALLEEKFSEAEDRNKAQYLAIRDLWQQPLNDLSDELHKQDVYREEEALRRLRQWLSRAEPETDYQDARTKRNFEELGGWLLEHPHFQDWESSDKSSIFWLYGFAGTGKTGLACRAIEHLQSQAESNCRFAFFFCSSDQGDTGRDNLYSRSDPEEALRSIVSRLSTSSKDRSAAEIVKEKYKEHGPDSDKRKVLSYEDCVEIILKLAKQMSIVIVLDAFDELNRNKSPALLDHLKSILAESPERVKVFISTRSFPAIENFLNPDDGVEVTTEMNGQDVRSFIHRTLEEQTQRQNLLRGQVSENLKIEIENTLASRARNMFLYASLMLSQICDPNNNDDEESVRKKLDRLPNNVTAVYDGVLEQIHDQDENSLRSCRIAQQTFKWLLQAKETPLCDFLVEAISTLEGSISKQEISRACRTLIVQGRVMGKDTFEFAHYSVREHVGKMDEYSASKCHVVALKSCLHALNRSSMHHDPESFDGKDLLYNYALLYWPIHFEGVNTDDLKDNASEINSLTRNFLVRGREKLDKYTLWFLQAKGMVPKLRDNTYLSRKLDQIQAKPSSSLFAACVFGIEDIIGKYGREPGGLNKTNVHGQTALCLAIENGNLDVVKALLSRRIPADINLLNVNAVQQFEEYDHKTPPQVLLYASALQCAAATGALRIVEYLVEEGAHVDLVAGYFGSPLQAAAGNGHADVVSLLLAKGAEPNSQGGFYGNALQAAAAQGHSEIINLLLENKPPALVDTPGGHYGSALMAAICSGDADTVWALLEEKAQPNLKSKQHGLPLEKAASMGDRFSEIVSLLLDVKAEADLTQRGTSFHLLHKAALHNMRDLAEYCLREGCPIDMVATDGPTYASRVGEFCSEMTPLGFACAAGHADMVEFLLDRGAKFELDKPNSAPLWTAASQGHAKVVELLIRRFKADTRNGKIEDFLARSPRSTAIVPILYVAVSSGSLETVQVLIEHRVEYCANGSNATPLMASATFAAPRITTYLLGLHKAGRINVEMNQKALDGRTALIEACARNRVNVAPLLLEAGIDYKLTDNGGATALHLTTNHNREDLGICIIEKALANDTEAEFLKFVNVRHSSGKTVMCDCAVRNRPMIFKKLLETGADYNIGGNLGNNPLHHAVMNGNIGILKMLLTKVRSDTVDEPDKFQEYINRKNKDTRTALWAGCDAKQLKAIEVLLDFGADWTIPNKFHVTALHHASFMGYEDIVTLILDVASQSHDHERYLEFLNYRNNDGKTALWDACSRNQLNIAERLLSEGTDFTIPSSVEVSWLHKASYAGIKDVVFTLLDWIFQNAPEARLHSFLNQPNAQGKTALWDACEADRAEIVQYLLVRGADWRLTNNTGVTPMMAASFRGNMDCVAALVYHITNSSGNDCLRTYLDSKNYEGKTAFIDASQEGKTAIVKLFKGLGADWTVKNRDGFTALHFAVWRDRRDTVRFLLEMIRGTDVPSDTAMEFLNVQSSSNKRTAICDAAVKGYTHFVKDLLDAGAEWSHADKSGKTPLHWAAKNKTPNMFDALINAAIKDMEEMKDCGALPETQAPGALKKTLEIKDGENMSVLDWVKKARDGKMEKALGKIIMMEQ